MTPPPSQPTKTVCETRAETARRSGDLLYAAGDDWFAVCYFYCGYHLVKSAMISDPIFDDATALSRIDGRLQMGDRYTTKHQGRLGNGSRELGVNDIVRLLYGDIAPSYRRLHAVSVDVRYNDGIGATPRDTIVTDLESIREAYSSGTLVYVPR